MTATAEQIADRIVLEDVLEVVSRRLMVDPEWILNSKHARRPQAVFARKMFVFVARWYGQVSYRRLATFLDLDERSVRRLFHGYSDASGVRQPGGFELVRSDEEAQRLAFQIREEIQQA